MELTAFVASFPHLNRREYATRCLSAAGLVPCLRPRLPTLVPLLRAMMEEDVPAIQQEAVQVRRHLLLECRRTGCRLRYLFKLVFPHPQGLCALVLVYGQPTVDQAAAAVPPLRPSPHHQGGIPGGEAPQVDGIAEMLRRTAIDDGDDDTGTDEGAEPAPDARQGSARGSEAAAAAIASPPALLLASRSIVLLLVDKCREVMPSAVASAAAGAKAAPSRRKAGAKGSAK